MLLDIFILTKWAKASVSLISPKINFEQNVSSKEVVLKGEGVNKNRFNR